MIKSYSEFKDNMYAGREKNIKSLMLFKKHQPYTYGQYEKRYQGEQSAISEIRKAAR